MTVGQACLQRSTPRGIAALSWVIGTALLLANLATLFALFGSDQWLFELITHFRVQLAAIQLAGVLYFAALGRMRPILLSLLFLLINLVPLGQYYVPPEMVATGQARHTLRVMTLNLNAGNDSAALVEHIVAESDPDVILFSEATRQWRDRLADLSTDYPYGIGRSDNSVFSIMMLSRLPLRDARILALPFDDRPSVAATVCTDDRVPASGCLTLLGTHPAPPITPQLAAERNHQLAALAEWVRLQRNSRLVMLGDLNTTPWSPVFRELVDTAELRDSALGFGLHPTWLSRALPAGLPIDHILVGADVQVIDRHVGADVGSDHFPVVADLGF